MGVRRGGGAAADAGVGAVYASRPHGGRRAARVPGSQLAGVRQAATGRAGGRGRRPGLCGTQDGLAARALRKLSLGKRRREPQAGRGEEAADGSTAAVTACACHVPLGRGWPE